MGKYDINTAGLTPGTRTYWFKATTYLPFGWKYTPVSIIIIDYCHNSYVTLAGISHAAISNYQLDTASSGTVTLNKSISDFISISPIITPEGTMCTLNSCSIVAYNTGSSVCSTTTVGFFSVSSQTGTSLTLTINTASV